MSPKDFPKGQWSPKLNDNAEGIDVRLLLRDRNLVIAQLRFETRAIFDAHTAPWDCHVLCLEGAGFVRVGDDTFNLVAGQTVFWPKRVMHQLWTDGSMMVTEMIEHVHQVDDPEKAWAEHLKSQTLS